MHSFKLAALALGAAVAASTTTAFAAPTPKLIGQQLLPLAKVSPARARSIALRSVHGTIVSQELEREAGGKRSALHFGQKTTARYAGWSVDRGGDRARRHRRVTQGL